MARWYIFAVVDTMCAFTKKPIAARNPQGALAKFLSRKCGCRNHAYCTEGYVKRWGRREHGKYEYKIQRDEPGSNRVVQASRPT